MARMAAFSRSLSKNPREAATLAILAAGKEHGGGDATESIADDVRHRLRPEVAASLRVTAAVGRLLRCISSAMRSVASLASPRLASTPLPPATQPTGILGQAPRIAILLVAALGLGGRVTAGEAAAADVELKAILVAASGRSEKPEFDPKIPADLKDQIKKVNLAYGKYDLVETQEKGGKFGSDVAFPLPDKESLVIKPSADETSARRARLVYRLLDKDGKVMVVSTMRVAYGRSFLIHRAKGASGLLMGVSASKPKP